MTTNVSRLILAHPDLGEAGGTALHDEIAAIYKKLGDNLSTRIMVSLAVTNGATATFEHDFRAPLTEIRYDLYIAANSDPYDLTRITATSSPSLSQFTVSATSGFTTTKIDVLNSSGSTRNLVLVAIMDPIRLGEGDVQDVDITTVAPQDGQALVWNATTGKFAPGASGDSSFKLQSVTTPNLSLKGGYLETIDGKELATYSGSGTVLASYAVDLTLNLSTIFGTTPANATNYYLYIDLTTLGAQQTISDTGRKVYRIVQANFVISTQTPEQLNPNRYVPVGNILSATSGTAWSGTGAAFTTFSSKKHYSGPAFDQTTAPQDGQALVYVAASDKYAPGASGDASFKLQAIASDVLTLKGGHIMLADGRELATFDGTSTYGGDISVNLLTLLASPVNGTTYYLYIDLDSLSAAVLDESVNRKIYGVLTSKLVLLTTTPDQVNRARYVALGLVVGIAANHYSTTAFKTLAVRFGDNNPNAVSPVVYRLGKQLLGTVGSSGQIIAGHILSTKTWPTALVQATQLAYWNLAANGNDNGPQGVNLSGGTPPTFTAANIFGTSSAAAAFNGSTQFYTNTTQSYLNPTAKSFLVGGRFNGTSWAAGPTLISQASAGGDRSWLLGVNASGNPTFFATNTAGAWDTALTAPVVLTTGVYHDIAGHYNTTTGVMTIYVDGKPVASATQATIRASTTNTFLVGKDYSGDFFTGSMQDLYFISNYLMTDTDVQKIFSYRLDHAAGVLTKNQEWTGNIYTDTDLVKQLPLSGPSSALIDLTDSNSAFFDFSQYNGALDSVELTLKDTGLSPTVVTPVPPFDTTYTAAPGSPVAHGQPDIPKVTLLVETGTTGQWEEVASEGKIQADATNLTIDLSALSPAVGAAPNRARIIAQSTRQSAVGVPDATTARSGTVTTTQQGFSGLKQFYGGLANIGNIRASEGSGTTTLTDADNRSQTFNLSAARTVQLPTTNIAAGDLWMISNVGAFLLTVQASAGAGQILTVANSTNVDASIVQGFVLLRALIATPTNASHWRVEHVEENDDVSMASTTFAGNNGGAQSSAIAIRLSRVNRQVTIHMPQLITVVPTTNSVQLVSATNLPVRFRPSTGGTPSASTFAYNNGAFASVAAPTPSGVLDISTAGALVHGRDQPGTTYTNSANAGFRQVTVSYLSA